MDKSIDIRCDWCGEMNEGVGYNEEYKTSFGCGHCGKINDIEVVYHSHKHRPPQPPEGEK